ncbi:TetR/AcrR family transcriptional regulator [Candidatus Nephthysia bennettiae]|uniref:TetR/AcrR family transcriptional regulator n=1 Tax=Candidatus Nephthysia bennettiae TaxID=3127016 RepID=A0A934KE22_9BACT|nr:TetR/AcrR family transcriptional regulator [Candidatus Dormibacteraeota bacterium]MBJ7614169.1 TetR/AcrR family transcriptional regulator [Candidatus Dormibacteraeota bacterium]
MTARRVAREAGTAERILDVAERLVQLRGFNGFSYADVAAELGVTKASLHYHFPGKAELGEALINRYAGRFGEALQTIDLDGGDVHARLEAYAALYASVLREQRMCLCGMLAADYETLPPAMRGAVVRFFDDNEAWLERLLEQGQAEGSLRYPGRARDQAQLIIGALEGAMLVARPYGDPERFQAAAHRLLATLDMADVNGGDAKLRSASSPGA